MKPTAKITIFPYPQRSNGLTRKERVRLAVECAREIETAIARLHTRYAGTGVRVELPEAITVDRETFLWNELALMAKENPPGMRITDSERSEQG